MGLTPGQVEYVKFEDQMAKLKPDETLAACLSVAGMVAAHSGVPLEAFLRFALTTMATTYAESERELKRKPAATWLVLSRRGGPTA
jgi:hypothetical protein